MAFVSLSPDSRLRWLWFTCANILFCATGVEVNEEYQREIKTKALLSELYILDEWIDKNVPGRLLKYQVKRVRELIEVKNEETNTDS